MKRMVQSEGYARARLVTGSIFAILGAIVLFRTLASVGLTWAALPAYVLGTAMIALGAARYREWFAARGKRA
jgi:hypothetical protein